MRGPGLHERLAGAAPYLPYGTNHAPRSNINWKYYLAVFTAALVLVQVNSVLDVLNTRLLENTDTILVVLFALFCTTIFIIVQWYILNYQTWQELAHRKRTRVEPEDDML
jgi:hypothetical protein